MSTFDAALERIKDYLWKPVTITDGDGDNLDALFFNIKELGQEGYQEFLTDTLVVYDFVGDFDEFDGQLNLEEKIFFGASGVIDYTDDLDTNHNLNSLTQIDTAYMIDVKNGTDTVMPVYKIDVDGTIIPGTLEKIADDISELEIQVK